MSFSYSADMAVQRDRVRLLYGDTDHANPLLQDAELGLVLTGGVMAQSTDTGAALAASRIVLSKYAHTSVDISAGGTSVSLSQRIRNLQEIVIPMLEDAAAQGSTAVPYAGGISRSDVLSRESDTDRVAPYFAREPGSLTDPARWGR